MKELTTEIRIQASAETIWKLLMDFEAYPSWNPFITSLSGKATVGHTLQATIQPPKGKPMNFTPKVLVAKEHQAFHWLGKLLMKGLFDGEHYFELKSLSETETLFIHGEKFSGVLIPLLGGVLAQTEKGFQMMNEALKAKAEAFAVPKDS